jgi:DNA-binding transcriptional ArsR family regulator
MTRAELDRVFGTASAYFSVMSDTTRLKILHAICGEEKTLSQIVAEVGVSRPKVTSHLAAMRRYGLIARRKRFKEDVYAVADSTMIELCRTICRQVGERISTSGHEARK